MSEVETPLKETSHVDPIDRLSAKRKAANPEEPKVEAPIVEAPKMEVVKDEPKVEAPKTEAKVEPKVEEKPKNEAKPKKSAKFWKKEENVEGVPEGKQEVKSEAKPFEMPKEVQEKLSLLDTILSNPSVKMVLQAEQSGKPFNEYYDELRNKDPYKMPYQDIYKMQLQEQGLSESEINRKMDKFEDKDEDEQLDTIAIYRKDLKGRFDKELRDYTPKIEQKETPFDYLDEEVRKVAPSYNGREIFGIEATPERLKMAADLNRPLIKMENGKIDAKDFIETKFLKDNFDLIAETIWERAAAETTEKLEEIYNVGKPLNAATGSAEPQPRKETSDVQKRIGALQASLPQRGK